jgi:hypothetical protein
MRILLVLSIALAACTGGGTTGPVDAAKHDAMSQHADAPHSDAAVTHDAPPDSQMAMKCTGLLYDSCNPAASNCASNDCHLFSGRGFTVCTQACSGANPCPAQNGQAVTCNNMGICVPNAPNPGCTSP